MTLDSVLREVEPILRCNGGFQFSHPSFQEVLATRQFAEEIISGLRRGDCGILRHDVLSERVVEAVVERGLNKDTLYGLVYSTRRMSVEDCGLLGGNSLTLLVALGEDLRGKDFSGTKMVGAKLTDRNLEGMSLRKAYVSKTDFACSNLKNVDVRGAVGFENCLSDSVDFVVVKCNLHDVYLLSKEGSIIRWDVERGEVFRCKVAYEMMSFLSQKYGMSEIPFLLGRRVSFNDGNPLVAIHHDRRLRVFDLVKGGMLLDMRTQGVDSVSFVPARSKPGEFMMNDYLAMYQGLRCDFIELPSGKDPLKDIRRQREERRRVYRSGTVRWAADREERHEFSWLESWAGDGRRVSDPFEDFESEFCSPDGSLSLSGREVYMKNTFGARDPKLRSLPPKKMISQLKAYDEITPLFFAHRNQLVYVGRNHSEGGVSYVALHEIHGKEDFVLKTFVDGKVFVLQGRSPMVVYQGKNAVELWRFDENTEELNRFYRFDGKTFADVIRD